MKTIVLASQNPVKIRATRDGFQKMFPGIEFKVETVSVLPGVNQQPLSDRETLQGALNRARRATEEVVGADYWAGIEGGIEETDAGMSAFGWAVVVSEDLEGKGRTGTFFLPKVVANMVRQGKELGEANDTVFQKTNSKQSDGAEGY